MLALEETAVRIFNFAWHEASSGSNGRLAGSLARFWKRSRDTSARARRGLGRLHAAITRFIAMHEDALKALPLEYLQAYRAVSRPRRQIAGSRSGFCASRTRKQFLQKLIAI